MHHIGAMSLINGHFKIQGQTAKKQNVNILFWQELGCHPIMDWTRAHNKDNNNQNEVDWWTNVSSKGYQLGTFLWSLTIKSQWKHSGLVLRFTSFVCGYLGILSEKIGSLYT